ncbi:uncharacterized protein [Temnothorax nylanderi]|uniref:uncharacterized protein n=1 Tax=Temnothorax nylanderi TaxID=102681 RepID=UPI003A845B6A
MHKENGELDWELIADAIAQGRTSWIYQVNKIELIDICKEYGVEATKEDSLDKNRQVLNVFVKEFKDKQTQGVTEREENAVIKSTNLAPDVFKDLQIVCEPEKPITLSYKVLKEKLKLDEKIKDFVLALRLLAKECKYANTEFDKQIKDQLIAGATNDLVRYELLKSSESTLTEMERLAETVEMASIHKTDPVKAATESAAKNNTATEIHAVRASNRNNQFRRYPNNRTRGQTSRNYGTSSRGNNASRMSTSVTGRSCFCCGKDNHVRDQCSLRDKYCSECGAKGHIFRTCPSKTKRNGAQHRIDANSTDARSLEEEEYEDDGSSDQRYESNTYPIRATDEINMCRVEEDDCELSEKTVEPHCVTINVGNIFLKIEMDTGAAYSAISSKGYKKMFSKTPLLTANRTLRAYNREPIKSMGYIKVPIEANGMRVERILYVIPGGGIPLLGRNWLAALKIWPPQYEKAVKIHNVTDNETEITKFSMEFLEVFLPGLGTFNKGSLDLKLMEGAQPRFMQPRRIPLAMREQVEKEIKRLCDRKIISPVEYSEWGTPVVSIVKGNGAIRLCGNFKVTLNKVLKVDQFPLPRVEEVLDVLRGGRVFTKLDLSEAYQQLPLTERAKKLVVISTHLGLFQYNRLPFGVSTGPGSFQRVMASLLLGIPGVIVFIDDILIAASDWETHIDRVREVLRRLSDAGLLLKFEKCKFAQQEIKYLGFRINSKGIHPSGKKIDSVKNAPTPKNVSEVKSFLGSINYYARFIKSITDKLYPLYECLKQKEFKWTIECNRSFIEIKKELSNELTLAHFDPEKPIVHTCDASPYGISAVLSHREANKYDRPICFASRTLTSEKRYAHHDKEGLSVVCGIRKFYQYLYGNQFTIQTDSTTLSRIFHPDKSIPEISTARLQRWAIFLSVFKYNIKHIQGKKNYANWLSRLPIEQPQELENKFRMLQDIDHTFVNNIKESDFASLDWSVVQKATREDVVLCRVIRYCMDGWPEARPKEEGMQSFWEKRDALSVESNCLL